MLEPFPQAISVSTPQTTVLILDEPPQNTSAVTLPNWEIIYFPTADLMNDPLGEPAFLLHLHRRLFFFFLNKLQMALVHKRLLLLNVILSQNQLSILDRRVWVASTRIFV